MNTTTRQLLKMPISELDRIRKNRSNSHEVKTLISSVIHYLMAKRDRAYYNQKKDKTNHILAKQAEAIAKEGLDTSISYMGYDSPFKVYA